MSASSPSHPLDPAEPPPERLAEALTAMREAGPLVQCLTNVVVSNFTANALLAAGAAPAMVDNPREARGTAAVAGGVLVNLGTPQEDTVTAMREAVAGAGESGTPWVLDPIGAGSLPWRSGVARELLDVAAPAVIRGNASEILGLSGGEGGRGADSLHRPEDALDAAAGLAQETGAVVAVSGPVDHVTDGDRLVRVVNGSPLLTKVTGAGCSLGAFMAAYAAVTDAFTAALAATAHLTVAADRAAAGARGPGSFAVALLDELSLLQPDALAAEVRLA